MNNQTISEGGYLVPEGFSLWLRLQVEAFKRAYRLRRNALRAWSRGAPVTARLFQLHGHGRVSSWVQCVKARLGLRYQLRRST